MKKFNVQVCQFPGGGITRPEVGDWIADALLKMKQDERIDRIGRFSKSDTPIPMVRNLAVKEAIDLGYDYILMIDNDMGPDYLVGSDPSARPFWDVAWGFMMNRRLAEDAHVPPRDSFPYPATIAAPYCGPPPLELPYIFRWKNRQSDNPDPDYYLECLERSDAAMRTGIEEVAALPTGLILYDVRVFKALEEAGALPWFDYEYADPPYNTRKSTTEDVWQTRNGTLLEPSLPLYVAWDCWAIHYKTKAVKKPVPVTAAVVKGVMREALRSSYEDHADKILVVNRHDPQFREPTHELVGETKRTEVASDDPVRDGIDCGYQEAPARERAPQDAVDLPAVGGSDHPGDGVRREGSEQPSLSSYANDVDREELRAIVAENC